MSSIKKSDLLLMRDFAHHDFLELHEIKLKGEKKPLDQDDRLIYIYYRAALRLLNKKGAIKPEFLKKEDLLIDHPDGYPIKDAIKP